MMRALSVGQVFELRSSGQFVQQRLRLLQIERVKSLCEPAVHRSEKLASLIPLALIAPEPRHAHSGAQSDVKVRMGAASHTSSVRQAFLDEARLRCIFARRLDRCSTFSQNWSRLRTAAKAQRKVVGNPRLSAAASETAVNAPLTTRLGRQPQSMARIWKIAVCVFAST